MTESICYALLPQIVKKKKVKFCVSMAITKNNKSGNWDVAKNILEMENVILLLLYLFYYYYHF